MRSSVVFAFVVALCAATLVHAMDQQQTLVVALGDGGAPAAPGGEPAPLKPAAKPAGKKAAAKKPAAAGGKKGSTGCPTMEMAYQKFKGDMKAIENASAAASKRALDAEKQAENEREAASRCLAAQRMMKAGPEADQAAIMQKEILRQVAKVKEQHSVELAKVKADMKTQLKEAVQGEKARQDVRIGKQLKAATEKTQQVLGKMKSNFKQLQDDTRAKAEKTRVLVQRLQGDLTEARQHATNAMAGAQRARETGAASAPRLRKINANNIEAIQTLKEALRTSRAEAKACEATKHANPIMRLNADRPCPVRMTELLAHVKDSKKRNKEVEAEATKEDQRLAGANEQLKASREQVASLEKELGNTRRRPAGGE